MQVSRYLLILTILSVIEMPITEHLWTWDGFLQGGRDFELGTIMVLSILCLALVLSKNLKKRFDLLLSARRYRTVNFDDPDVPVVPLSAALSNFGREAPPDRVSCTSHLPLLI